MLLQMAWNSKGKKTYKKKKKNKEIGAMCLFVCVDGTTTMVSMIFAGECKCILGISQAFTVAPLRNCDKCENERESKRDS